MVDDFFDRKIAAHLKRRREARSVADWWVGTGAKISSMVVVGLALVVVLLLVVPSADGNAADDDNADEDADADAEEEPDDADVDPDADLAWVDSSLRQCAAMAAARDLHDTPMVAPLALALALALPPVVRVPAPVVAPALDSGRSLLLFSAPTPPEPPAAAAADDDNADAAA